MFRLVRIRRRFLFGRYERLLGADSAPLRAENFAVRTTAFDES
jgi:hypothetical protein